MFKPDTNKLNCAAAPAGDNCIRYSDMSKCTQCALSFAIASGSCATPGTTISDCSFYGTATECRRCIDNKMPINAAGASCVDGLVTNCRVYTRTNVC